MVYYRRFVTTYRSHLQGPSSFFSLTFRETYRSHLQWPSSSFSPTFQKTYRSHLQGSSSNFSPTFRETYRSHLQGPNSSFSVTFRYNLPPIFKGQVAVSHWRFGTTYQSLLQGPSSSFSLTFRWYNLLAPSSRATYTAQNPKELRSKLQRCWSLFSVSSSPPSLSRGETNKVGVVAWTTRLTRPSCLLLNVDQRSAPPNKLRCHTLSPCLSPGSWTVSLRSNRTWMYRNTVPCFISGDAPKCQPGKFSHVDRKRNLMYRRLSCFCSRSDINWSKYVNVWLLSPNRDILHRLLFIVHTWRLHCVMWILCKRIVKWTHDRDILYVYLRIPKGFHFIWQTAW
jgi:hypothetical protein